MDNIKCYFDRYISPIDANIKFDEKYFKVTKPHSNSIAAGCYEDTINKVYINFYSRETFYLDDRDVFNNILILLNGKVVYRNEYD